MADIQNLSPKAVKPIELLSKTNEVIDAINESINSSYSEKNPALTVVEGVCTWTVTHNLNTEEVSVSVYENDEEIFVKNTITSENVVTITINSSSNISAETYSVLVLAKGGVASTNNTSPATNSGTDIQTYYIQGLICNDNRYDNGYSNKSTLGYGNCTVTLFGNQKAMIEYSYTFTRRWTDDSNICWGLNPELLSILDSNIPSITPILGGKAFFYRKLNDNYYNETGITTLGYNGYGATNVPVYGDDGITRWSFGRIVDLGSISQPHPLWYPVSFEDYDTIMGTCWGTID